MSVTSWTMGSAVRRSLPRMAGLALLLAALGSTARAQGSSMSCADAVPQDPAKVFRSGLWKQWIHWSIPGPTAYAALQRIVGEVNQARAAAGLPRLVPNPAYEIVVSVFEERNARGANGSSAFPGANREAFLAAFVDDTAGGFEVLFLAEPLRSNPLLAAKGVPGSAAQVHRSIEQELEDGDDRLETRWSFVSTAGDEISFSARYRDADVFYDGVAPLSRVAYANCNLTYASSLVFRSSPAATYDLFAREESSWIDTGPGSSHARARVKHHDPDVHAIFNDPMNVPELLIALDRDVRIQVR